MERTKKKIVEDVAETTPVSKPVKEKVIEARPKLTYKLKGGSLKIFGRMITTRDTFTAFPEEIPASFLKDLICLSSEEDQRKASLNPVYASQEDLYVVKPSSTAGWFNVINEGTGKKINEKSLTKADAERLKNSLNA